MDTQISNHESLSRERPLSLPARFRIADERRVPPEAAHFRQMVSKDAGVMSETLWDSSRVRRPELQAFGPPLKFHSPLNDRAFDLEY